MKIKINFFLLLFIFIQLLCFGQEYEKMSKRKLRKAVPIFLRQIDSLKQENLVLYNQGLELNNKQLIYAAESEKKLALNDDVILNLNKLIQEGKAKLESLRLDVLSSNTRLNHGISDLKDSVLILNKKNLYFTQAISELEDFISLTDMLKAKDGEFFISDWLRNRNTVEFLGIWESVYNPTFNYGEFAIIKIWVEHGLPNTEELHGVPVAEPVGDKKLAVLGAKHVGEREIITVLVRQNRHGRSLDFNGGFFCFAHGVGVRAGGANSIEFDGIRSCGIILAAGALFVGFSVVHLGIPSSAACGR